MTLLVNRLYNFFFQVVNIFLLGLRLDFFLNKIEHYNVTFPFSLFCHVHLLFWASPIGGFRYVSVTGAAFSIK